MNSNYFGKLVLLGIGLSLKMPILGIFLLIAIGHIIDIRKDEIIHRLTRAFKYQKRCEDIIFLIAYFCYFLGLNNEQAKEDLKKVVILKPVENIFLLFDFFYQKQIPKLLMSNKINEELTKKVASTKIFLQKDPNEFINFFAIIEFLFNQQGGATSIEQANRIEYIASIFNIRYQANYNFNSNDQYHFKEEKFEEYDYTQNYKTQNQSQQDNYGYENTNNKEDNTQQNTNYQPDPFSQDVKDACAFFNVSPDNLDLTEVKKIYKKRVMKVHPDIIKSQNFSDKKIKQAEDEMLNLNKYMDIIKKFLANN